MPNDGGMSTPSIPPARPEPLLRPFRKMHGAGNDFIVLRDDAATFPDHDAAGIARLCAPHTGIACDGLILLRPPSRPDATDFRMVFVNPDGSPAGMCGNGARCAALCAYEEGLAPASMRIETGAGLHRADILPDGLVRIGFPAPAAAPEPFVVEAPDGAPLRGYVLDTGVPHAVVPVAPDAFPSLDIRTLGAHLRRHPRFAPAGTNVDFAAPPASPGGPVSIRTYERGVEDETLACGTGIVATARVAADLGWMAPPVTVRTVAGDLLRVDWPPLSLTGPAVTVFTGTLDLSRFFG